MAKAKKKEEVVKLHNRSKREYILRNGAKSFPGRALDVPKSVADFHLKNYPADFILYEDLAAPSSTRADLKKTTAENKKLTKENADLLARIAELEANTAPSTDSPADPEGGDA
jgi:hypothetical protein